jgi:hypothetical protein
VTARTSWTTGDDRNHVHSRRSTGRTHGERAFTCCAKSGEPLPSRFSSESDALLVEDVDAFDSMRVGRVTVLRDMLASRHQGTNHRVHQRSRLWRKIMRADTPSCAKSFPLQMGAPVLQTTQCACDVYRKSVSLWTTTTTTITIYARRPTQARIFGPGMHPGASCAHMVSGGSVRRNTVTATTAHHWRRAAQHMHGG